MSSLQQQLNDHLQKGVVGFPTAIACATGLIMASPVILTVTTGFGMGGSTFAIAMLIAIVMMLCQATTFAEAAAILPTKGSVYDYISCGMGRFFALTGTISAYLIVHVFAGTAETMLSGVMALINFQSLHSIMDHVGGSWVLGVVLIIGFAILNIFGISVFSKCAIVLTFLMWTTLTVFGILGLLQAPTIISDSWFGNSPASTDWKTVLSLVGMAMFMFVGCEFVVPIAPELINSAKTLPRAMIIGLLCVGACMFMYGSAMGRHVENIVLSDGSHILETPLAIPLFSEAIMEDFGRIWLGLGLLFAAGATLNTLMAGVPRILYGMAIDGALPKFFTYLHPKYKTPVVCIVVSAIIPCIYAIWLGGDSSNIMHLILAAVCAWAVAYLLVTISIVRLRIKRPDLPRAYKSPFFPIPQIISSIGMIIGLVFIAPPGISYSQIYLPFGIMLGLTAAYSLFWTILVQKINPFRPVPIEEVLKKEFRKY